MLARRRAAAQDPIIDILVLGPEQALERIQAGVVEVGDMGVREAAHQQVHLAEAATPGAEAEFLAAIIHGAGGLRAGKGLAL